MLGSSPVPGFLPTVLPVLGFWPVPGFLPTVLPVLGFWPVPGFLPTVLPASLRFPARSGPPVCRARRLFPVRESRSRGQGARVKKFGDYR